MSNDPQRPLGTGDVDDLQFDRVETAAAPAGLGEPVAATSTVMPPGTPGVTVCGACNEPITDVYFEANGKIVCPRCRDAVGSVMARGSGFTRILAGVTLGILAGALGAAVWYAVRVYANSSWSLIAIGIAMLVGGAIRYGSGGRGGIGYQILAVVLTYVAICANYVPDVYQAISRSSEGASIPVPVRLVEALFFSLKLPFLMGLENVIGIIIILIGLWVAWQSNKPNRITFNGPYRIAGGGPPPLFPSA